MKTSAKISFGAILAALALVLLFIGGITSVLDLASAALASFCVIFAVIEMGYGSAFLVYAAASALGLMLLPAKTPVMFFAVFFGYYPIIKSLAERLSTALSYVLKLLSYSAAFAAMTLLSLITVTDDISNGFSLTAVYIILYFVCAAVFTVYDLALTRMISLYIRSLRKRLDIGRYKK